MSDARVSHNTSAEWREKGLVTTEPAIEGLSASLADFDCDTENIGAADA
jgi:hypothetical protein